MLICYHRIAVLEFRMKLAVFVVSITIIELLPEVFPAVLNPILELIIEAKDVSACQDSLILVNLVLQIINLPGHLLNFLEYIFL